jgi:hypothetical protein
LLVVVIKFVRTLLMSGFFVQTWKSLLGGELCIAVCSNLPNFVTQTVRSRSFSLQLQESLASSSSARTASSVCVGAPLDSLPQARAHFARLSWSTLLLPLRTQVYVQNSPPAFLHAASRTPSSTWCDPNERQSRLYHCTGSAMFESQAKTYPPSSLTMVYCLSRQFLSHSMFEWQMVPAAYLAARVDEAKIATAVMRSFMVVGFGLVCCVPAVGQ